jgi:hypothetical protein
VGRFHALVHQEQRSGASSAKLLKGARQRFSGFNQPRQCGDDVLWMLVTGGPPARDDGGTAHEIDGGRSYLITILGWRNPRR